MLRSTAFGGTLAILAAATPAPAMTIIDGDTRVTVPGADSPSPWGNFGNLTDLTGLGGTDSQLAIGNTGGSTWLGITDGGELRNSNAYIGFGAGSNGAVLVEGTGIWNNTGDLTVGRYGAGTLDITGGGTVTSKHSLIGANADGTVNIEGRDSTWTIGYGLTVGVYAGGEGTLNIRDGAVVSVSDPSKTTAAAIGNTGKGTANITGGGSTLNVDGFFLVGRGGAGSSGTMNILDGGAVAVTNGSSYLSLEKDSTATVTVDGKGSTWTTTGSSGQTYYFVVGYLGDATLNITNGGFVSTTTSSFVANQQGSTGAVTVSGTDEDGRPSTWKTNGILYLGGYGDASLTIADGGLVSATYVWASTNGGAGTINIGAARGDTALAPGTLAAPSVQLGRYGSLVFNHTSDDYVFAPRIYGAASALGQLYQVAGTTILTANNTYGGGTTISGGTLQLGNGGATGSITGNVLNDGVFAFNRSDAYTFGGLISSSDDVISGGAVNQIGAGTTTLTAANSYRGATTVSAGALFIDGDQSKATGDTTVRSGATLGGNGIIGGKVTVENGGILEPGKASDTPGTLTINGDLVLSGGAVLNYNFGESDPTGKNPFFGGPNNDLTVVKGNLTLDGTINVTVSPGGSFGPGIYHVFTYDGTLTDNTLELGAMPPDSIDYVQTSIKGQVNLVNANYNNLALRFWDGDAGPKGDGFINGGNGIWRVDSIDNNWTAYDGHVNAPYENGSFAVFAAEKGVVIVDNSGDQGPVVSGGMQFTTDGYRIEGDSITLADNIVDPNDPNIIHLNIFRVGVGNGSAAGISYVATIAADLIGDGGIEKIGRGILELSGANSYTGETVVTNGTLRAGAANAFSPYSAVSVTPGGRLDLNGFSQEIPTLTNAGLVNMGSNAAPDTFTTLTVAGNYAGDDGMIVMRAVLNEGGANSRSDMLVVNGDTSGATGLYIVNAGGFGAQTIGNGIELIRVNGNSDGQFSLANSLAAGAYSYGLFHNGVGADAADGNWYLRSSGLRPEVPVYSATPALAADMGLTMLGTLFNRNGATQFYGNDLEAAKTQPTEIQYSRKAWGRAFGETGSRGDSATGGRLDSGGPATSFNLGGVQAGGDLYRAGRDNAGFYVSAGRLNSTVEGVNGADAGKVNMDAYAIGGYWTHRDPNGWYTDLVLQGAWYENIDAITYGGQRTSTNGFGFAVSGETGYRFALGSGYDLAPQAQVIYQHISIDDTADAFSRIGFGAADEVIGRLGCRLAKGWTTKQGKAMNAWAETNIWHRFGGDADTTFANLQGENPTTISADLDDTWGQVGVGISGQVTSNVIVFVNGNYNRSLSQTGHSFGGHIGIKVSW